MTLTRRLTLIAATWAALIAWASIDAHASPDPLTATLTPSEVQP